VFSGFRTLLWCGFRLLWSCLFVGWVVVVGVVVVLLEFFDVTEMDGE
jgi:hypothetical protein